MKRGIIIILIMMSLQAVHGQFSWNHDLSAIAKPWSNSSWIYFKDSSQIDPLTIFNEYNEAFNLSQDDSLALIRTTFTPSVNMAHYVYQQYYKDIKVEGGYITIHSKNDYAQDANGAIIQGISLNITPTLNATAALDSALLIIGANKYMWQDSLAENSIKLQQNDTNATYYPKPELIIASIFSDSGIYATNFHLCYKIDIISYDPNEGYTIYIDANSGKSLGIHNLFSRNNCESGTVNTLYNGTQNFFTSTSDNINYKLKEDCNGRKIETYYSSQIGVKNIFEQSSNTWDVSLSAILASAHWAAEKVFEFYSSYNHIGYDNDPTTILKTVYLDYDGDYVKWDKSQN